MHNGTGPVHGARILTQASLTPAPEVPRAALPLASFTAAETLSLDAKVNRLGSERICTTHAGSPL